MRPWAVTPQGLAVTVRLTPRGGRDSIDGIEHRDQERAPMVTVTNDGPYAITGGVELMDVPFGEGASREHYTLCRCGGSKNKPFCDGAHWSLGFRDPPP